MHSVLPLISILAATRAVSAQYLTWDEQELAARNFFDAEDYLGALEARWTDKAIQAGKDAIAVNHAEKSSQGNLVLPDKVVEFAGRVEGQLLPKKNASPMKPNPPPTAAQSKQGKTLVQDIKASAQMAVGTTKNTIGNQGKGDAIAGAVIGGAEGVGYHVGGKIVDAVANAKAKASDAKATLKSAVTAHKKAKRDLEYVQALYVRELLLDFENELQTREFHDMETW